MELELNVINITLVILATLAVLSLLLLRVRRQTKGAARRRPVAKANIPLPDVSRFRPINVFFTVDHLKGYLGELAAFQRDSAYRLADEQIRRNLQRVVKRLILAGQVGKLEKLPEGDLMTLYLAILYSHFISPDLNPVFHSQHNAALARTRLLEAGLTRHAAMRVSRAIKEYPLDNPVLNRKLAHGLASFVAGANFQPGRYGPLVRQALLEVLEKSEADYEGLVQFIQARSWPDAAALGETLYLQFGASALSYPPPSTPELWENVGEVVVLEPDEVQSVRDIRLYSVGTPGGRDLDFAVVNVPRLTRRHIALGPLDLFINDTNAAAAILARKTMDSIYERRPKLYQQWQNDKDVAKDLLGQGKINMGQYNGFKAMWHKERGLPWTHYGHKQGTAEELAALPEALKKLIRPRGGGYNQITLLLHDCNTCVLPTLDTFFDYMEYFGGQREGQLVEALGGVIEAAAAAVDRMRTEHVKSIQAEHVRFLRYFWNTIRDRLSPPKPSK